MGNLSFAVLVAVSLTVLRFPIGESRDFTSEVHVTKNPFQTAVASWNVLTPGGSWIETELRVRIGGRFTSWYAMGHWSADLSDGHRHSVKGLGDADGRVDTDTLILHQPADAWQARVYFHGGPSGVQPTLSLLAVTTDDKLPPAQVLGPRSAWGIDIEVPQRSQHIDESPNELGGGGEAWCSPTSVSMVMAYWATRTNHPGWNVPVPAVAKGTYDPVYDGCGNWPFNVAFASEHGLSGWVERLANLSSLERYIASGIPLIASIRVRPGELDGAPYAKTDGHLLVVRGFTSSGDVITCDPAGRPGHIRIVYKRAQFEHVWMGGSQGIVYVIAPPALLGTLRSTP